MKPGCKTNCGLPKSRYARLSRLILVIGLPLLLLLVSLGHDSVLHAQTPQIPKEIQKAGSGQRTYISPESPASRAPSRYVLTVNRAT